MDKSTKKSSYLFIMGFVTFLWDALLHLFLANTLTPMLYGDFNIAIKCLKVFVDLTLFGTSENTPLYLAKYIKQNNHSSAVDYIAWNIRLLRLTLTLLLLMASLVFGLMMAAHIGKIKDVHDYHLAVYIVWVTPIAAIALLLRSYLLSYKQIYLAATFPRLLVIPIQLLIFLVVIFFLQLTLSNLVIVTVILLSYIFAVILSLFFLNRNALKLFKLAFKNHQQVTSIYNNDWFKTSSKLIASTMTLTIINMSDLVIVKLFVPNKASVGHYAAVLLITSIIWFVPKSIYPALQPYYSSLVATTQDKRKLQKMFDNPILITNLTLTLICVLIIVFATPLLALFGPTYVIAKPLLIVLTISIGISLMLRTDKATLLSYSGHENLIFYLHVVELFLVILFTIPATIYYGVLGTAVANGVIVLLLKPMVLDYVMDKKLGIPSRVFGFLWRFF